MRFFLTALRPRHWTKNSFVFAPLLFGKKLFLPEYALAALVAFGIFCAAAGAAYLLNDFTDRCQDRRHPLKRDRPVAAGMLKPGTALWGSLVLGFLALAASAAHGPGMVMIVGGYLAANLVYSFFLKKIVLADVFCLALFFLLRIYAGAVAVDVRVSHWLLISVFLLSLFLGFAKRRQEIRSLEERAADPEAGALPAGMYNAVWLDQILTILTPSVALVYTLYTMDSKVIAKFGSDYLMYTVPFVYFGLFRYLYLIQRRRVGGDPTAVLFSDTVTQVNLLLWLAGCVTAIYFL